MDHCIWVYKQLPLGLNSFCAEIIGDTKAKIGSASQERRALRSRLVFLKTRLRSKFMI
jgi:hypothetical protein